MTVKQLTEQHLEFLGLKGGCTGSSESTLVKMPHCFFALILGYTVSSHCHAEYFYVLHSSLKYKLKTCGISVVGIIFHQSESSVDPEQIDQHMYAKYFQVSFLRVCVCM